MYTVSRGPLGTLAHQPPAPTPAAGSMVLLASDLDPFRGNNCFIGASKQIHWITRWSEKHFLKFSLGGFFLFFFSFSLSLLLFFFFYFFLYSSEWDTPRLSHQLSARTHALEDSGLVATTVQVHTRKSTLLSSTHWLRIKLHISLNHDRRKQTVKQNHSPSFSLSLLFSLVCPYHSHYHERAQPMERSFPDWLPASPKTIKAEISSQAFVTPSK